MLGVLTMFAARLGPFYPANHSPSKIETKKNRENLQVPAGVVLCLEPMRVLEQVHRNAVVMWATPIENGSLPQGGHGLTNTQIQNRLKRVFKLTVAFSTPIENRHKNSTSFCVLVLWTLRRRVLVKQPLLDIRSTDNTSWILQVFPVFFSVSISCGEWFAG